MKKAFGIGFERYKEFFDKSRYYVDKTGLIPELLERGTTVNLFTRPRRFGKTLALSMLRTFFELEFDSEGQKVDNSRYFAGMEVQKAGETCLRHMGKYPVISLSLKSAKQPDYALAYTMLIRQIGEEFSRHSYVREVLTEAERNRFQRILDGAEEEALYLDALWFLSSCLKKYHGVHTIILMDEYDVPLENALFCGFYEKMVSFLRTLFESALKTNDNLEFAVITGCLRISREGIFTGLNNLEVHSVLNDDFAEYFGFTQQEITDMLEIYGISERMPLRTASYGN